MLFGKKKVTSKEVEQSGLKAELFEWLETIAISLIAVVLIFTFVFRIVGVDGDSMLDTLYDGDRLIITHMFYEPEIGDIVIVTQPNAVNKPLVKRIIAMGGQTVDINTDRGEVYVDGELIYESYIKDLTTRIPDPPMEFPYTVPEGKVFVMGDNRLNSLDSRSTDVGAIDERYILGKAIFRIFPFNRIGGLYDNMA
ncbi:MAG: signal peptidase I [Oscillospiraceae bacterium]|nr:signal peptidase I [Oscillospiraceae bacterium]